MQTYELIEMHEGFCKIPLTEYNQEFEAYT